MLSLSGRRRPAEQTSRLRCGCFLLARSDIRVSNRSAWAGVGLHWEPLTLAVPAVRPSPNGIAGGFQSTGNFLTLS